ncbi:glycosyltransferase family 39 protein [Methylomonas sp. SURF-2]|uniref:Glycosyltransferase family 39 protein n=1 Tax=Methylomonas subterranea TaxID=2952225 RepID=A0ABT1THA1_9GAMM|nr:glycosyltransferase family 39 protein [Methylomonas sp. SURF-2]MCQ8104826.1 glycosyltransferase family 39 protein [Methylomonas sp. SURF-2]
MQKDLVYRWGIFPLWLLLTTTIFFRNPVPIDETRYLSVAWEMWLRGDFLVPYLNGHTYSHKPPLLFWLFESGWAIFGVNEWWPRLVGPICALLNLLMTRHLAFRIWPDQPMAALKAPWILLATLLWTLFASSTMFDTLLTCCVLLGMLGLIDAIRGNSLKGWSFFALSIGLGLLAKGPVIFLHLLPTALLVFVWAKPDYRFSKLWPACLALALLAGCAIALTWALPAALAGGAEYADAILWHQTADRTLGTKIHARPFPWYLYFLPLITFPWIAWPRLWQSLRATRIGGDVGLRFSLTWLAASFLVFSLLPSKQLHYLMPMLPALALFCARLLPHEEPERRVFADWLPAALISLTGLFLILLPRVPGLSALNWVQQVEPGWGLSVMAIGLLLSVVAVRYRRLPVAALSTGMVTAIFIGFIFFFRYTGLQYNLRPAADMLKQLNQQQIPTAFVGDYQGQLHFLGRITQPLEVIEHRQVADWAGRHPNGYLIYLEKTKPARADYLQPHREFWLFFKTAAEVLSADPA